MTHLLADVRAAVRQAARRPALPLTAVATLTAGLGIAIGVFAIAWAVVWRPLDLPEADRLVWIESQSVDEAGGSSPGAALTWQDEARTLDAIAMVRSVAGAIADDRGTDRLAGALVSESIFGLLGVRPVLGRTFTAADAAPGATRVLLISHQVWQSRYGADPFIVDRAIALDGRAATIIGVLPAATSTVLPDAGWWAPLGLSPDQRANLGARYLDVVGRLAAAASPDAARQELSAISSRLALTADDGTPLGVRVTPLADYLVQPYRAGLSLLLAAVIVLVLIACANVATLLLTRAQDRGPEFALRASLGASQQRIAGQLLTESAVLAAIATVAALVVAMWLTDALRGLLPAGTPRLASARIDGAATLFALGAGVAVTLFAGVVPALRGSRIDLQSTLRAGATASHPDHGRRLFVIVQVALAVVLAGAGALLVRSAAALERAPRGYESSGVLVASVALPSATFRTAAQITSAIARISGEMSVLPGVTAAAAASQLPFAGGSAGSDVALAGDTFEAGTDRQARVRLVSPGYGRALAVQLHEGREIAEADGAVAPRVVVVNETLARRLTPSGSPVGRDVTFGVPVFNGADGRQVWRVVGVTADTWDRGPRVAVEPEVWLPVAQTPPEVFAWISGELQLAVRTDGDAAALGADLRRIVTAAAPGIAIGRMDTLDSLVGSAFARERLMARLLAGLGAAGLGLALVGLFASIHHDVHRRRREIAIRLAIGATSAGVVAELVASGARLAGVGAVAGSAASIGFGGLLASLLFGVSPGDPLTLGAVAALVVTLAVVAAWLPARRAAAIDPADALRS